MNAPRRPPKKSPGLHPEDEIVDELRRIVDRDWRVPIGEVVAACEKAVAEIERLRLAVREMAATIARLEAEQ